jgi:hypothetical protein
LSKFEKPTTGEPTQHIKQNRNCSRKKGEERNRDLLKKMGKICKAARAEKTLNFVITMNNKIFFMSMVASLLISMTACQKEPGKTTQNPEISQEDLALSKRISSFVEQMNNPYNLKSDGKMDVDSAIWYVEAAMNYTFADIPELFSDTKVDTMEFVLNVRNGSCTETDLSALYQAVDLDIQAYCSTLGEYQLLGVDINMNDKVSGDLTVCLISGRGGYVDPALTFRSNDYWYAYGKMGKCGAYEGQYKNERDATTEIQRKANYSIPMILAHNGVVYYTDFSTDRLSGWDDFNPDYKPGIDDPLKERLLYYEEPINWDRCLSPELLNFYLTNLKNFGNSHCPSGKDLVSYECKFDFTIPNGVRAAKGYHYGVTTYGVRHVKPAYPIK